MVKMMDWGTVEDKIKEIFPKNEVKKLKINGELDMFIDVVMNSLLNDGYSEQFVKGYFLPMTYRIIDTY